MILCVWRASLLVLATNTVLGDAFGLGDAFALTDSSCLKASSADECRSMTEEGTGDKCVWCTCRAVPNECLGASIAKKLPKAVFTCDDVEEAHRGGDASGREVLRASSMSDGESSEYLAPTSYEEDEESFLDHSERAYMGGSEEPSSRAVLSPEAHSIYDNWRRKHGVDHANRGEFIFHSLVFHESLNAIEAHHISDELRSGKSSYSIGLNRFSDTPWDEFRSNRLGFGGGPFGDSQNCSAAHVDSQYEALGLRTGRAPPPSRDWRDFLAVSEVKDQDHCGSCWTFSTTGCLESHHFLRTGDMVLLSEQQLVDCAGAYDNHGCKGGLPSHAFEYIASAGGLDTEAAYPYLAEETGSCDFAPRGIGADVIQAVNITFQDEAELLEAVGNTGPVSVAFQVAPDFKAYDGGVYDNPDCSTLPEKINHAVLAVGYDTTEDGIDYWIIKNSWGPDWGIDGYFHMVRGKNMCGIADCASFPLVP